MKKIARTVRYVCHMIKTHKRGSVYTLDYGKTNTPVPFAKYLLAMAGMIYKL